MVNRAVESLVLGSMVSKRVDTQVRGKVYKQDTEEVQMVKRALKRLIEANNL